MANWMTVSEISARYIVGEQKLLDYARRGNMPMLRCADGVTLFDESHAAQLFRPRVAGAGVAMPTNGKPNMGVLGASRLGEKAAPKAATPAKLATPAPPSVQPVQTLEPSERSAHRRALRFSTWEEKPEARVRKAAG